MPNWVKTNCNVTGPEISIKAFRDLVFKPASNDPGTLMFDFSVLVPEPEGVDNMPFEEWYDWHHKHWGTKWWGQCVEIAPESEDHTRLQFSFETAWTFPTPIFNVLAEKFRDLEFSCEYADEDRGYDCGRFYVAYNPASEAVESDFENMEDLKDSREFARGVWGDDYEDEEEED